MSLCAGAGLGGLEGLGTAQLGGGGGLDGLGGLADGGGAGDGVLTEVGAVVALGGGVDDGGVEPEYYISWDSSGPCVRRVRGGCGAAWAKTYLREPLAELKLVSLISLAGWCCLSAFLTRSLMLPFSPVTIPMAYS
jgi:hypothetical protein